MGGGGGAEDDEVGAVVPLVVDAGEEVLDVEGLVVCDAELLEVEVDPAGLFVVGIEIDDDQDGVGALGGISWYRWRGGRSGRIVPIDCRLAAIDKEKAGLLRSIDEPGRVSSLQHPELPSGRNLRSSARGFKLRY